MGSSGSSTGEQKQLLLCTVVVRVCQLYCRTTTHTQVKILVSCCVIRIRAQYYMILGVLRYPRSSHVIVEWLICSNVLKNPA